VFLKGFKTFELKGFKTHQEDTFLWRETTLTSVFASLSLREKPRSSSEDLTTSQQTSLYLIGETDHCILRLTDLGSTANEYNVSLNSGAE
jgi:hypothetical protein